MSQVANKTYGAFSQLPTWAKGIIGVTVTGVAVFAVFKGYKAVQKWKVSKDAKAVSSEADNTFDSLRKKGQKLTYPEANYSATVNTITHLLNGGETPTSEVKVVNEIGKVVKKPIDWFYLVSIFGSKDIEDIAWGKTNYDLISLLKEQLDSQVLGDVILGERRWSGKTLDPLTEYLGKMGVSI